MLIENATSVAFLHRVLPSKKSLERGLLVLTAATAVLSLVPPFRVAGSIATRSVAIFSSLLDGSEGFATRAARVGGVVLGLTGLLAASPLLLMASVATDIGLQAIETAKAAIKHDAGKALTHLSLLAVDSLLLAGIIAGSWKLLLTASCVSIAVLSGIFLKAAVNTENFGDALEAACYAVLIGTSMASAISCLKVVTTNKTKSHFSVTNSSKESMVIYDKHGKALATCAPGESLNIEVPYKDTLRHQSFAVIPGPSQGSYSVVPTFKGSYVEVASFDEKHSAMTKTKCDAVKIDEQSVVLKHPLPPQDFPTLPLGGYYLTPR